jgi:hypothetical protein
LSSELNGLGCVWIGGEEGLHADLEAGRVEGVDGECTVTALSASGAAGEPWAGAERCIGESAIHQLQKLAIADLHEFGVVCRRRHTTSVSKNDGIW